MTKTATVIGAGIGGPAAAIMLSRKGYEVTLHEKRSGPGDFNSLHMLTLQEDTFGSLRSLGIPRRELSRYDSSGFVREISYGRRGIDNGHLEDMPMDSSVMWDDLHDALARRCTVTYGSDVTSLPEADVVIWADGVGSYGRNFFDPGRKGTYAGEMVFRGYAPRRESDMDWYQSVSDSPGYNLVSYPCWDRDDRPMRGWTLMLNNQREPWDDTEILSASSQERLNRACRPIMHDYPYEMVSTSVETTGSPQLTWARASQAVYRHHGSLHYILGDALGTVTPRTALGANIAVMEALAVASTPASIWEKSIVGDVNRALEMSREYIEDAH